MKIILLTRSIYPIHGYGGMERHCYDWALSMTELGCRVHAVTMPPSDASRLSEFPETMSFYFVPGRSAHSVMQRITFYPLWISRVEKMLHTLAAQIRPAAVYAQGLAVAACRGLEAPIYHNPHGMEEFKCGGLKYLAYAPFRRLARKGSTAATRIVATDQALLPEIKRFFHVSEDRIVLLPNAVRYPKIERTEDTDRLARQWNIEQAHPLFLAVGRMEFNKGFHVLLEALSRTTALPATWRLAMAGNGSKLKMLKKLAQKFHLENNIVFTGTVSDDDLDSLYRLADLFITPTLYEGSSIVTLEAMKHKLPVLGTRAGGLPDKVIPGKNGWLVPPNDPDALAAVLEEAWAQKELWPEMGRRSAQIIEEKYSWTIIARQFLELLRTGNIR